MNAAAQRNVQVPLVDPVKNHVGASISDAYRSLIRFAINAKLHPKAVELEGIPRVSVFFPPALFAQISEIAELHQLSYQSTVAGLAIAGAEKIAEKNELVEQVKSDVPFRARPEQVLFYQSIMAGLSSSKIVVAEASTGVGKGRALMAAAIASAQNGKLPVIVAAPTVVVVNQLWAELQVLRTQDKMGPLISATILPGSADLADDVKLLEWANDPDFNQLDPAVTEWILKGGPHKADDAMAQVAKEQGITLCWMMSDLHEIATNFPSDDYVLTTNSQDKATLSQSRELLAKIREAANRKDVDKNMNTVHAGADIILCTHAMLALGQITKWAVLPQPKVLIVDEAHLLEETISRMNSQQISLFSISYRLSRFCRATGAGKGTVARVTQAHAKLFLRTCMEMSNNDIRQKLNDDPSKYDTVQKGLASLANMVKNKVFKSDPTIQKDMYSLLSGTATMMAKDRSKNSTHLQFSPDRRYPLISVGADTIGMQAGAIWKAVDGGAVLASATMYITDEYGNQKCDYVVRNLSIPLSRLDTPLPVVSSYIYTLPTLYLPKKENYAALSRPALKERESPQVEKEWMKNIADVVAKNAKTCKGGTLVLTNSYDQIDGISTHLKDKYPEIAARVIVQVRKAKFSAAVNAFTLAHSNGVKPIMIGLGPAWTGLNLSQDVSDPKKDTLLMDLVIACSPIGLNQTATMLRRIEQTNTSAIAKEGLLILKQGLGRLIRRDGVEGRRIWILDGRIWSDNWLKQFTGPAKRLLGKYKNVAYF